MKKIIIRLLDSSMKSYSTYLREQMYLPKDQYINNLNRYYQSISGVLECGYITGDIKDEFINLTNKLYEWRKEELEYYENQTNTKRYTFRP